MSRIGLERREKTEASQHDFEAPVIFNVAAPALADVHETVITRKAAGSSPRCKKCSPSHVKFWHAPPDHNSATPVAAVALIVYADYADCGSADARRADREKTACFRWWRGPARVQREE
jgi:hypothetical protein